MTLNETLNVWVHMGRYVWDMWQCYLDVCGGLLVLASAHVTESYCGLILFCKYRSCFFFITAVYIIIWLPYRDGYGCLENPNYPYPLKISIWNVSDFNMDAIWMCLNLILVFFYSISRDASYIIFRLLGRSKNDKMNKNNILRK